MQSPAWHGGAWRHGGAWGHGGCRGARCTRGRAWRICLYLVITSEMTKPICHAARCTRAHAVHARQRTRKPEGRAGPTPSSTSRRPGGPASPGARGCASSRSHPSPPPPPPAAPQTRARTPARASARAGARTRVGAVGLGRGRGRARAAATRPPNRARAAQVGIGRRGAPGGTHTHTPAAAALPASHPRRVQQVVAPSEAAALANAGWPWAAARGRRPQGQRSRRVAPRRVPGTSTQGGQRPSQAGIHPAARACSRRAAAWQVSKFEREGSPGTNRPLPAMESE